MFKEQTPGVPQESASLIGLLSWKPPITITITININSGYLLYKIRCKGCNTDIPGCNGYYIGRTVCLRERLLHHKFCVLNERYRNCHLYKHIFACAGTLPIPFTIMPFYKVRRQTHSEMQAYEEIFREKFKPDLNTL